jgi:O-acetyl-ADP-ribose deacetylase (regulator of RNase III)
MKINYIKGDLLSITEGIIVHVCNAQGVMGSGVALAVRQEYPKVYKAYKEDPLELGDTQGIMINDNLWVINAITQEFYGRDSKRYVSYEAVKKCFTYIFRKFSRHATTSIPKIGAGLGGGDWERILQIIKKSAEERCYTGVLNVYEL